eukprot:8688413-Alexandrium_andersonii.AAC.1
MGWTALRGPAASSTRCETLAHCLALCAPFPVHLACNSQGVVARFTRMLQAMPKPVDFPAVALYHGDVQPWPLDLLFVEDGDLWNLARGLLAA